MQVMEYLIKDNLNNEMGKKQIVLLKKKSEAGFFKSHSLLWDVFQV